MLEAFRCRASRWVCCPDIRRDCARKRLVLAFLRSIFSAQHFLAAIRPSYASRLDYSSGSIVDREYGVCMAESDEQLWVHEDYS